MRPRPTSTTVLARPATTVTVRPAAPADQGAIARLSARDSKAPPPEPRLVAERDGTVLAVYSLADGSHAADPFEPTAELVALLRVHVASMRAPRAGRVPAWAGPRRCARLAGDLA